MSVASINTRCAVAAAAIDAGDFATALSNLRSARVLMAALPDSSKGDTSLRWDRASIDRMIADLTQQQTQTTMRSRGIRRTSINYKNPSSDDCE